MSRNTDKNLAGLVGENPFVAYVLSDEMIYSGTKYINIIKFLLASFYL